MSTNSKSNGLLKPILIISIIGFIFMIVFPLIIWDALGNGAEHFMRYSGVGVAGVSSGSSKPTFFFGLLYTFEHLSSGFIPLQLYSAQWRVLMGITEASATADALGVVTLICVLLLGLSFLANTVIGFLGGKIPANVAKWYRLGAGIVALIAFVILAIIAVVMYSHVRPYGFRTWDFMAYGGIKTAVEAVLAGVVGALSVVVALKKN